MFFLLHKMNVRDACTHRVVLFYIGLVKKHVYVIPIHSANLLRALEPTIYLDIGRGHNIR